MGAFDNYKSPPSTPSSDVKPTISAPSSAGAFSNYKPPPTVSGLGPAPAPIPTDADAALYAGGAYPDTGKMMDTARVAANAFGLYDRIAASAPNSGFQQDPTTKQWVSINDPAKEAAALEAERAKTTAAAQRIGPVGAGVANLAGYLPAMALMPESAGGAILASGGVGGLSAAGRGESVPGGIATGLLAGVGGTALGAALNPLARWGANVVGKATGMLSTPAEIETATAATARKAWNDLNSVPLTPSDVAPAYNQALSSLTKNQLDNLSDTFLNKFNSQKPLTNTSVGEIAGLQRNLQSAASSNGERFLAAKLRDNLDSVFARNGVIDDVNAARDASKQAYAAEALNKMSTNLKQWKESPSATAREQAQYYDPGSAAYEGWQNIYNKGLKGGGLTSQSVSHAFDPVFEAIGGAVAGVPGAMVAGSGMQLLKPTIGGILKRLYARQAQNAISQQYPLVTPMATKFFPDTRNALINVMMSQQAGVSGR